MYRVRGFSRRFFPTLNNNRSCTPLHILYYFYLFIHLFIFFKEKADWDGVPPLYSEAGGLKVASPGVLFISPYCVSGRWSLLPPVAISSVLLSFLVFFILFFLKLYDAAQMHI